MAALLLVAMSAYEESESRVLIPRVYGRALRLPSSVVLFALLAGGTRMGIAAAISQDRRTEERRPAEEPAEMPGSSVFSA